MKSALPSVVVQRHPPVNGDPPESRIERGSEKTEGVTPPSSFLEILSGFLGYVLGRPPQASREEATPVLTHVVELTQNGDSSQATDDGVQAVHIPLAGKMVVSATDRSKESPAGVTPQGQTTIIATRPADGSNAEPVQSTDPMPPPVVVPDMRQHGSSGWKLSGFPKLEVSPTPDAGTNTVGPHPAFRPSLPGMENMEGRDPLIARVEENLAAVLSRRNIGDLNVTRAAIMHDKREILPSMEAMPPRPSFEATGEKESADHGMNFGKETPFLRNTAAVSPFPRPHAGVRIPDQTGTPDISIPEGETIDRQGAGAIIKPVHPTAGSQHGRNAGGEGVHPDFAQSEPDVSASSTIDEGEPPVRGDNIRHVASRPVPRQSGGLAVPPETREAGTLQEVTATVDDPGNPEEVSGVPGNRHDEANAPRSLKTGLPSMPGAHPPAYSDVTFSPIRGGMKAAFVAHPEAANAAQDGGGILNQIVSGIMVSMGDGTSEMKLRLVPESLGELHVSVKMEEGKLFATIDVRNPSTRNLIEMNISQLHQALGERGVTVERINILGMDFSANRNGSGNASRGKSEGRRGNTAETAPGIPRGLRMLGYNTLELTI